MKLKLLLIFTIIFLSSLAIQIYASTLIGDIQFNKQAVEDGNTTYGYYDGRALLRNIGNETRTVTIGLSESSTGRFRSERTVTIPADAEVYISLPVPPKPGGRNNCFSIRVHETGEEKNDIWVGNNTYQHSTYNYRGNGYNFIVLTPLDPDMFLSKLKTAARSGKKRSKRNTSIWDQTFASKWDQGINKLSRIWQGLGRFDGIIIKNDDLKQAASSMRQTLTEYIITGGTLIIFDTITHTLPLHPTHIIEKSDNISIMTYGFGHLILLKTKNVNDLPPNISRKISTLIDSNSFPSSHPQPNQAHNTIPVIGNVTVPLRSTFFLMTLFSILAGPVLIFILCRKNRRIWLNWTIPTLAIFTSAVLVIYALISEGITSHIRLSGITYLNQIDHMAATLGTHGYYTPYIPEKGLKFNTASSIIKLRKHNYSQSPGVKQIDWTNGQNFKRGWLSARVPEYFSCRTAERRRERIHFSPGSKTNKLNIINGLGADIKSLSILDRNGNYYQTTDLKAGTTIELTAITQPARSLEKPLPQFLSDSIWQADNIGKQKIRLMPGTYLAKLNEAPFMENGISYKKCQLKAKSIIYGVWEISNDS